MKLFALTLLVMCFLSLSANYVQNQPYEYANPDGTKLSLSVSGDEFEHQLHDKQGFTVLVDPQDGYAVYAESDGTGIKPSMHRVGLTDPASLGLKPHLKPDYTGNEFLKKRRSETAANNVRTSTTGTLNNIVIFIRFLDQNEYQDTSESYNQLFNTSPTNSMNSFFLEDSNNQLAINSTFYPAPVGGIVRSFQDGHNRGYFSPYNAQTNPEGYSDHDEGGNRLKAMLRQAVISIGPSVPASVLVDADNDAIVDNVTFIAQGDPDPVWLSILWPQSWVLDQLPMVYINSKIVYRFTFLLSNTFNTGTACHEMSHALGFPDLYHYSHDGFSPVGDWDLMGSHGDIPQQHLAYMKWKYGAWFASIPTISPGTTATTYTLSSLDQNPFACYKIDSTQPNQFYVLEYRRATGNYESGLPGSGLIVYRVCTENGMIVPLSLEGNNYGPPDEVYIYRPGESPTENGTITEANYTVSEGRTDLHNLSQPKPWLYTIPWIGGLQVDGNLMITDVTSAGGATISFTVHGAAPSIWKGTTNADWNTASNWSTGAVPNYTSWVEIPPSVFINGYGWTTTPLVTGSANARHISILQGAGLFIGNGMLTVEEVIDNFGTLGVTTDSAQLVINGDLTFYSGSTANVHQAALFKIKGDLNMLEGSDVDLYAGCIEFVGTGTSYIRNYEPSRLYQMRSSKNYPYAVYISDESTQSLTVKDDIYVNEGSTLRQSYGGETLLGGSLLVYENGFCALEQGTFVMQGFSAQSINLYESSSYLNHLIVNKSNNSVLSLSSNIWVKHNIGIHGGVLNASTRTIRLGGNWTNSIGTAGFNRGVSTLMLVGADNQTISSELFYRLELNKTGGQWTIPTGVAINTDYFNWTSGAYSVTGGSFGVAILDDPGVFGTINLVSGTISYNQSSSNALDLRGTLSISGGTFNLSGGNGNVYFGYIDAASLTMSGGVLDLQSQGIFIPSAYSFTDNVTGGTIRTVGSLTVQRTDFNPTGGIIEFYNSAEAWINVAGGSNVFNLLINKASTGANSVTGLGTLDINGYFKLQAGSFVAPSAMKVAGNWQNMPGSAAFAEGTGSVTFDGAADQYCNYSEAFYTLILNKSNKLKINNALALVSCASYNWLAGSIEVLTGNFTAYDLVQNGIYGSFYVNSLGTLNLNQDSSQWIDLNGFLYNNGGTINISGGSLPAYPAYAADGGLVMTYGTVDFKNNGLVIMDNGHALTWDIQGGTIALNGSVVDYRGSWINSGGTVKLYGPNAYDLILGTGSQFYNLSINKASRSRGLIRNTVYEQESQGRIQRIDTREELISAGSDIHINGTLNIEEGCFDPSGHNVYVANDLLVGGSLKMLSGGTIEVGDDVNWLGMANVNSGTINCGGDWVFGSDCTANLTGSSVYLLASYGCNITNNSAVASFGNLEIHGTEESPLCNYINSTGAALRVAEALTIWETNTLNLNQNPCTTGSVNVQPEASLIVGDGGSLSIQSTLVLAGTLDIGPGSVYAHGFFSFPYSGSLLIDGGSFVNDSPWIERGNFHLRGAISINAGTLEIVDNSVYLYAHPTRIFINAALYMGRSFTANEANAYHPEGGTLFLTGDDDSTLRISAGNYLANLVVQQSIANSTIHLGNPTTVLGDVQINSGILDAGDNLLGIGGNLYLSSYLGFSPGGSLQMAAGQTLYVLADGFLSCSGSTETPVIITRGSATGYYSLHVEAGGTISSEHTVFEYLDSDGVYIQSGATVDPQHSFFGCTFRNSAPGGRLLRVDNSQVLTISNAVFPANSWGGSCNIAKTVNQGELYVINFSGDFAGSAYEQDVYNRIAWHAVGIFPVQNLSINKIPGTMDFVLLWDYAEAFTHFKIYVSPTPDGDYALLGTSLTNSFNVSAASATAFFRVVVVRE